MAPNLPNGLDRIYKLSIPPTRNAADTAARLAGLSAVEYAEPNYLYQLEPDATLTVSELSVSPGDALLTKLWGLNNSGQTGGKDDADVDALEAWEIITGTASTLVAVIDSGVDYTHPDLNDGRVRTDIDRDYVNDDLDAMDDNGHGTHVAGTIAAEANNGIGVSGLMWQAQILPLKVCDETGSCPTDAIASAIRYAADHGAAVANLSLGGGCGQTIAEAVNYAHFDKDMVVVASAGNSGGSLGYPARHEPVISVGATDYRDRRAYFSSYGDFLDVVAPGVTVLSTVPGAGYEAFSGTSMAAPHVTGIVGLLLSQRPDLTADQVAAILNASADDLGAVGFDRVYGHGRVNAHQALLTATPAITFDPERALCEECAVEVAMEDEAGSTSVLADLRLLRDERFAAAQGLPWARLYARHQAEVLWLFVADSDLRATAVSAIRGLNPAVESIVHGDGGGQPTLVSQEMVDRMDALVQGLAASGSDTLSSEVLGEWQRLAPQRFVGWTVSDAWQQVTFEAQARRGLSAGGGEIG
jgi:hypothetical protein